MILIGDELFSEIDVAGDGNCLFRAISEGLYRHPEAHFHLRDELTDYVAAHWAEFQNEMHDEYATVQDYVSAMKKNATYGGYTEIRATAELFNVRVKVFQRPDILIVDINKDALEVIHLLFNHTASHYSALLPVVDASSNSESFTLCDFGSDLGESSSEDDPPLVGLHSDSGSSESVPEIGGAFVRPIPVHEIDHVVTSRMSCRPAQNRMTMHFLWAGLYAGETAESVKSISLGQMEVQCPSCGALFWEAERLVLDLSNPYWCCGKKVQTVLRESAVFKPVLSNEVRELYFGESEEAEHFRRHMRAYNIALSMAIPRANYGRRTRWTESIVTINGVLTLRAPAFPSFGDNGLPCQSGQLFFVDVSDESLTRRVQNSTDPSLRVHVLELLERYLRQHNGLVKTFVLAGDIQRQLEANAPEGEAVRTVTLVVNPHKQDFRITDRTIFQEDRSALRPPGSEAVAAVFVGGRPNYRYDMVYYPRNMREEGDTPFININESSPMLDSLMYPLIHLHGEDSWTEVVVERRRGSRPRRQADTGTRCGTIRQYYSARLMVHRDMLGGHGVLMRCRGLYQQWLCDAAVKIMDANLRYAETHQDELQVCMYDSLRRFVTSEAERLGRHPGRIVILPPNEQKSERHQYANYIDAVCIASKYGAPDLFMTMTSNPRWPEVVECAASRGLAEHEFMHMPDVLVRAYLGRCNALMHDVINQSVFGQVLAYVGVHEFTSTMLPHFHLAVILNKIDRPDGPETLDTLMCAEIPSAERAPELHKKVMALMLHRPCDGTSRGYNNPPCRADGGVCRHGFPKPFAEESRTTTSGAVLRRRRTAPLWHARFGCFVDNRWVVEYNPKMLRRYDCHFNLKLCGDNIFFKYLFGYMEKESTGHHVQGSMFSYARRQAEQTGVLDWDEIQHCRDMRLVGPYEACFRIFGLPFARLSHAVESLPIHLPDRQYVYYRGDAVAASRRMPNSKLLAWFRLNAATVCARDLLYAEVVTRYKWENGSWLPKGPNNCLGRLMHVNPSPRNMELFYLRLILLNVRGATTWDDLLTVDGRRFDTFKEASLALGIRSGEEGKDYDTAMAEVVTHGSPWQLRRFFATLIAACDLQNTTELWLRHREAMSARSVLRGRRASRRDLINARQEIIDLVINADNAFDRTALERMLTIEEEDVSDAEEDDDNIPPSSVEAMNVPPPTYHLTDEQQVIFNAIMGAARLPDHQVLNHRGFAVMAPAGCGKTVLFNKLLQTCKDEGMPAIACALTAIAALLFLDGETCHKTFGIPIRGRTSGKERSFLENSSPEAEKLRKAKLILIDEVSMLSAEQAILVDELLRMVMGKPDLLFGGKCVVLGGDMAQVLPVIRGLSPRAVAEHTVRAWVHWPQLQKFSLTRNMRALSDPEFAAWLEKVRDGSANLNDTDEILIPQSMLVAVPNVDRSDKRSPETRLTEAIVQRVFGDLTEERCRCSVIVSPTNDAVIDVNQFIVEKLPGCKKSYFSVTTLALQDTEAGTNRVGFTATQEELDRINPPRMPPHCLELKVGCIVMLLLNLNKKQGLCNGTRFVVRALYRETILVERLTPYGTEPNVLFLPRMMMRSDDVPAAGTIQRFQFPLRVAFAMTINKVQGQSFDYVGLFLRRPVFSSGQFFVGVGRGRRGNGVFIGVLKGQRQGPVGGIRGSRASIVRYKTLNIVFRELLA